MIPISIHAPTRGATGNRTGLWLRSENFNPRSHKGSDKLNCAPLVPSLSFQSTLPQGERRRPGYREIPGGLFQSTLPQGERLPKASGIPRTWEFQSTLPQGERHILGKIFCVTIQISIHAPTRGATTSEHLRRLYERFQSTLPQGERRHSIYKKTGYGDFNPRSHKGSDNADDINATNKVVFQSTLPQGERPFYEIISSPTESHFNPRSHKGSD